MATDTVKIRFQQHQFKHVLDQRIRNYFLENNTKDRDNFFMYMKIAGILTWFAISYYLLVFVSTSIWEGMGYSVLFVASWTAIGFNIMHDGNHSAISKKKWINRIFGCTLDFFMGGSSQLWQLKHNKAHHTYTNIADADDDISLGWFARIAPEQPHYAMHRYQHIYIWILYGFLTMRWQLFGDMARFFKGKEEERAIMHTPGNIVLFFAGKLAFIMLFFVIPMLFHSWWVVLLFYVSLSLIAGIVMATVFQLAHCVDEAEHPEIHEEEGYRMAEDEWIRHQLRTTVDFAPKNWFLTFYFGGINYQVEHHLWPHICHIHYPKIAAILEKTCKEFSLPYKSNQGFFEAIASHQRFLKRMGAPLV